VFCAADRSLWVLLNDHMLGCGQSNPLDKLQEDPFLIKVAAEKLLDNCC
jgi:hypothetical protein